MNRVSLPVFGRIPISSTCLHTNPFLALQDMFALYETPILDPDICPWSVFHRSDSHRFSHEPASQHPLSVVVLLMAKSARMLLGTADNGRAFGRKVSQQLTGDNDSES